MTHTALVGLLGVEGLCALALVFALVSAMRKQSLATRRHAAASALVPVVRDAVTTYLGGNADLTALRKMTAQYPQEVEACLFGFQARLGGDDRERLGELAVTLGLVQTWCEAAESQDLEARRRGYSRIAGLAQSEAVRRMADDLPQRGLKDEDPKVRLEAARALLESGQGRSLELAFRAALTFSPLAQLEIASLLRRHAMTLCESTVPKALKSGSPNDRLTVLRLLNSWECALPLPDVEELADHDDPRIRRETMRLLALLPPTTQNRRALLNGLTGSDLEVSLAAVAALDRLKMRTALPQLTSCLRRGSEPLAHAAAGVLSAMGPEGIRALQDQLPNPDPIASGAAQEALEQCGALPAEACA
jgi:hypothetical protein